ncbi:DUF423 domain-containing protein [Natronospira bacteriovora]|uniref:DUF423 domain-containing protein n=1 Tax=Natronospira bacteriovora TaxID=3069753 RepID=A0ABU0WA17_9GAMM|nr:DUF423 domain-containing protein [Natronospira sp. AB-CW4]MDQ2070882.1 DUF423 domain-containing protein [Natronospira sp. AB-CW4]
MPAFSPLFLGLGAVNMAIAVALGAFGAHALRSRAENLPLERGLAVWETAVQYHLIHGLALLGVALAAHWLDSQLLRAGGWLMLLGVLLFSGSLYLLVLTGWRLLGPLTPLGGLCFIAAWLLIATSAFTHLRSTMG